MLETARRAALVTFPLLTLSLGALLILLITGHFEYSYVYQTTDLAMPLYLKVAALWGGQEGSALLVLVAGWLYIHHPWCASGNQTTTCSMGNHP